MLGCCWSALARVRHPRTRGTHIPPGQRRGKGAAAEVSLADDVNEIGFRDAAKARDAATRPPRAVAQLRPVSSGAREGRRSRTAPPYRLRTARPASRRAM
jgi:hypothetical protein